MAEDNTGHFDLEEIPELTSELIARATDAINFGLVAFGVPERHRAYIDALIGASRGSMYWFEAADIEIGQRIREASSQGLKEKSLEKCAQRERDSFCEFQTTSKITLIESMPGGVKDKKRYKTQYRLKQLFEIALEIDRRARATPGFASNPKRALRKAAARVFAQFSMRMKAPPKLERFRRPKQTCDTYLKLAQTYLKKASAAALLKHPDFSADFEAMSLQINDKRELLKNSTAPLENQSQTIESIEDDSSQVVDTFVHYPETDLLAAAAANPEPEFVHTSLKDSMDKPEPHPPPCDPSTAESEHEGSQGG